MRQSYIRKHALKKINWTIIGKSETYCHREDDQRRVSRALISRGLGWPVLMAPRGEDPHRRTGGN